MYKFFSDKTRSKNCSEDVLKHLNSSTEHNSKSNCLHIVCYINVAYYTKFEESIPMKPV